MNTCSRRGATALLLSMGLFQGVHAGTVEVVVAGQLRPGELLPVVVSPSNREQLLIRWGEVATPPVGAVG